MRFPSYLRCKDMIVFNIVQTDSFDTNIDFVDFKESDDELPKSRYCFLLKIPKYYDMSCSGLIVFLHCLKR